ncbi:hypothetical protein PGTUg99_025462 [Puccinia graminis f. sp. tritici]|uniref:Uncharacterized protein n=1 Tax=Puccinia graminis f. sp. tritici TaxID=56615 RepID=A0A5B0Q417_PUCGR|nr:hypothetical protein PGTUg99_025462 [Puccinia graminis f. sp. tritici]
MTIHPRYLHVALIAVCFFPATKCFPMGDIQIDAEHTAINPVEKFTSTSETERINLDSPVDVADHMRSDLKSKETAEDFIVKSLDPLKNSGLSRKGGRRVEIPQTKDVGVTINLMKKEFHSLKINLEEAKDKLSKIQVKKIEEIHQGILFLIEICQDELEDKRLCMRIPRLIHHDDTLYSTFLNLISCMPFFHMHQVENEDGRIIRGNIFGKVMKKIGKNKIWQKTWWVCYWNKRKFREIIQFMNIFLAKIFQFRQFNSCTGIISFPRTIFNPYFIPKLYTMFQKTCLAAFFTMNQDQ